MQRNISLDVLRGVAILTVVFHHSNPDILPNIPELSGLSGSIYWFIHNIGWSGVDLFFVLSGFLIGGILLNELEKTSNIKLFRFYLSRAFKIWPSYFLFIAFGFSALQLPWVSQHANGFNITDNLLSHVFFLQNYLPPDHQYHFWNVAIGPAWSLAVEEHFYLLMPLILLILRKHIQQYLIPTLLILIIIVVMLRINYTLDGLALSSFKLSHFRFDALLTGVLLNYLWRNNYAIINTIKKYNFKWLFFCLPVLATCHFYSRNSVPMFTLGFSFLSMAYAVLLLLTFENWSNYLNNSRIAMILAKIGSWSYNIYLWHCLWPIFFRPDIAELNRQLTQSGLSAELIVFANIIIFSMISILIGYLMSISIENIFLKLRKKLIQTSFSPFKSKA